MQSLPRRPTNVLNILKGNETSVAKTNRFSSFHFDYTYTATFSEFQSQYLKTNLFTW